MAIQSKNVLDPFLQEINAFYSAKDFLSSQLLIGGTLVSTDVKEFQENGGNILIGTPGRIQELLTNYSTLFKTKNLQVLILDEADRLLDMGFEASLNAILNFLPKQRRTGLFSATMSDALNEWIRVGLRNPVKISVKVESLDDHAEQRIPETLKIFYTIVDANQKWSRLIQVLNENPDQKFILYVATCAVVDFYYKLLSNLEVFKSFYLFSLHGKMDPKRRQGACVFYF